MYYSWHWGKIISLRNKDKFYEEIYREARNRGLKIELRAKVLSVIFIISRKVISGKMLHKIQDIIHR